MLVVQYATRNVANYLQIIVYFKAFNLELETKCPKLILWSAFFYFTFIKCLHGYLLLPYKVVLS